MNDAKREAYRLAVVMADQLLQLRNKIRYGMKLEDHPELPKALRNLASRLRDDLPRIGCLTPDRSQNLKEVESEVAEAESQVANDQEVWAALSRAASHLNCVFLDVNEAFFKAATHP